MPERSVKYTLLIYSFLKNIFYRACILRFYLLLLQHHPTESPFRRIIIGSAPIPETFKVDHFPQKTYSLGIQLVCNLLRINTLKTILQYNFISSK